jgi:hypothetical protein
VAVPSPHVTAVACPFWVPTCHGGFRVVIHTLPEFPARRPLNVDGNDVCGDSRGLVNADIVPASEPALERAVSARESG